jgi:hypothetical protein
MNPATYIWMKASLSSWSPWLTNRSLTGSPSQQVTKGNVYDTFLGNKGRDLAIRSARDFHSSQFIK